MSTDPQTRSYDDLALENALLLAKLETATAEKIKANDYAARLFEDAIRQLATAHADNTRLQSRIAYLEATR